MKSLVSALQPQCLDRHMLQPHSKHYLSSTDLNILQVQHAASFEEKVVSELKFSGLYSL